MPSQKSVTGCSAQLAQHASSAAPSPSSHNVASRRLLGLDQTELARELGGTRQALNAWESCRASVTRVVRLALRLLLGNRKYPGIPKDDADAGIAHSTSEAEQRDDRPHRDQQFSMRLGRGRGDGGESGVQQSAVN
jgi:hypothetical protein